MTKTHAEFLEELKYFLRMKRDYYQNNICAKLVCKQALEEIEQFQPEQKQETSNNNCCNCGKSYEGSNFDSCESCSDEAHTECMVTYYGSVCLDVCIKCYDKLKKYEQKQVGDEIHKA